MEYHDTIIVGGGPAGSSCAWQLTRHQQEVLILDKQAFPRLKLCAGWVPAKVLEELEFTVDEYPHSIMKLKTQMHFTGLPLPLRGDWALPWRIDYSIRRIEFDHWLLRHSKAPFQVHPVRKILKREDGFIIDGKYRCKYLIGAGGTGCPVRRIFFPHQRTQTLQISTLEKEFKYPQRQDTAHLFFAFHHLKGYAWYVPKANGYLNLGLGGFSEHFKASGINLRTQFQWFLEDLVKRQLLDSATKDQIVPSGHGYYLYASQAEVKRDDCFLIGDAAGLATLDLAEGIGPAVESGLMAANDILGKVDYQQSKVNKFSLSPPYHLLQKLWLSPDANTVKSAS